MRRILWLATAICLMSLSITVNAYGGGNRPNFQISWAAKYPPNIEVWIESNQRFTDNDGRGGAAAMWIKVKIKGIRKGENKFRIEDAYEKFFRFDYDTPGIPRKLNVLTIENDSGYLGMYPKFVSRLRKFKEVGRKIIVAVKLEDRAGRKATKRLQARA